MTPKVKRSQQTFIDNERRGQDHDGEKKGLEENGQIVELTEGRDQAADGE